MGGRGVNERPTLFLGLLSGIIGLLALLSILWFLPLAILFGRAPKLVYLPLAVPGLIPAMLMVVGLLLLIGIATGYNALPGTGPRRWATRFFYPATVHLGGLLRIHRDRIAASFVEVNNGLVRSRPMAVPPERLLLLMPHCLQHTNCGIRITAAVTNCKGCGKCDIAELVELSDKIGGRLQVATGGTLARRIITEMRPGAIVAVACERDLIAGIQDTYPLPVLGILNRRPHGPCRDTGVDMEAVEEAVAFFLGRPSPD
jgi:hypothetical protein